MVNRDLKLSFANTVNETVIENAENPEEIIAIEVPWNNIKFRFHLFFLVSILILFTTLAFNLIMHFYK
jgi:hypothetical protein